MGVNGLQILVADDHARMRDCIVCVLSAEFEVVGAVSDGDELVKAALVLEPDVIVSDICMPKLSGIAAKKCLQEHGVDIPFVFISANPYFTENGTRDLGVCVSKTDLESNLNAEVRSAARERAICR
jgi:DNA-binding NarL/FixJ family response regulator